MVYLGLLILPLLVAIGFYLFSKGRVTLLEFGIHIAAQLVVAGVFMGIAYWSNTSDTEVWNGRVDRKVKETVSCSHSYQCHCHKICSGSGDTKTCQQVCSTCYEHLHDYDWAVYTNNAERVEISRVDRQGTRTPSRWEMVRIGEPTAIPHTYTSYIKASPGTLFRRDIDASRFALPAYPQVYDYYKLNRVIVSGVPLPNHQEWNLRLSEVNARLGSRKEVNIILVVVANQPPEWFHALRSAWLGGKKNDAVVVVSVDADHRILWADVMAWTKSQTFQVKLRDALLDTGTLEMGPTLDAIEKNVEGYYQRRPMEDFAYLKASIVPTTGQMVAGIIFGVVVSLILGFVFHHNDSHSYSTPSTKWRSL